MTTPYVPQTWHNIPETDTPISAATLIHMDLGIVQADTNATAALALVTALQATVDALTAQNGVLVAQLGIKADKGSVRSLVIQSGTTYPTPPAGYGARELDGAVDPALQVGLVLSDFDEWNQPQ